MNIPENEKVHLRHLFIEVGLWCNLSCRHCYQGEMQNLSIRHEYIDALCESTYEIDELSLSGGEISLYVNEMKMIMDKLIENNIKVNYVNIYTNAKERNEELLNLFNWFRWDHTTFPEKAIVQISADRFHTSCDENFTKKELDENIEWFREKYQNCDLVIIPEITTMSLQGKAKTMDKSDFFDVDEIIADRKEGATQRIEYKETCCENENICGYGCVKNCITSDITLGVDGYLYFGQMAPAFTDRNENNSIGHIMSDSILELVKQWNNRVIKTGNAVIKSKNNIGLHAYDMLRKILGYKKGIYSAVRTKNIKLLDVMSENIDFEMEQWNNFISRFRYSENVSMPKSDMIKYNNIADEMGCLKVMTEDELNILNSIGKLTNELKSLFSVAYLKLLPPLNLLYLGVEIPPMSEYENKMYDILMELLRAKNEWDIDGYIDAWNKLK